MPICFKRKIIFVHIPRTAGTSFEHFLGLNNKESWWDLEYNYITPGSPKKSIKALQHLSYSEYVNRVDNIRDFFIFAIVRNPYTRFKSDWKWRKTFKHPYTKFGRTFDYFLDEAEKVIEKGFFNEDAFSDHLAPQYNFVHDENGICRVDHIGGFEELGKTVELIREKFKIQHPSFFGKNSTKYVEDFNLTDDHKERIYRMYKIDFDTFGYTK